MRAVSCCPVPLAVHSIVLRAGFLRLAHGLDEGSSASAERK
jgi:hypothetical protein